MIKSGIRVVPKMMDSSKCVFVMVEPNGNYGVIAEVHFPIDGQMNDNLTAAQAISDILKKRIKQSV